MNNPNTQPFILMYHGIITEWTALPDERETGADLYDVLLKNFQAQMSSLNQNGFQVCSLDDQLNNPDFKKITLTFDDGEMNNFDQAFPVLKKFNFPAYFFLIAKRVGHKGYMGWDELHDLHEAGMVIGSHGFSHEILTNLIDTQIEEELGASKKYLEKNLGIDINMLSIPRGFCDNKVIRMAYEAGYKQICISDRPKDLQLECYSRIAIKSGWNEKRFMQMLNGEMPMNEQVMGVSKNAIKRVFGGGVYDWLRKTILKIK